MKLCQYKTNNFKERESNKGLLCAMREASQREKMFHPPFGIQYGRSESWVSSRNPYNSPFVYKALETLLTWMLKSEIGECLSIFKLRQFTPPPSMQPSVLRCRQHRIVDNHTTLTNFKKLPLWYRKGNLILPSIVALLPEGQFRAANFWSLAVCRSEGVW